MAFILQRGDIFGAAIDPSELNIPCIDSNGKLKAFTSANVANLDGTDIINVGAMVEVATITLGSAGSIILSGVLDLTAYKYIMVCWAGTSSAAENEVRLNINEDDTNANYRVSYVFLKDAVPTQGNLVPRIGYNHNTIEAMGNLIIELTNTNGHAFSGTGGGTKGIVHCGTWINGAAITKIGIRTSANNWIIGSSMTIYGIA